jgi:hypothetical protein
MGAPQPQSRDDAGQQPAPVQNDRDTRQSEQNEERRERDERPRVQAPARGDRATPGDSAHRAGPAPVAPPEHPRHGGDDDLARRM